jgi:hypothetical protein
MKIIKFFLPYGLVAIRRRLINKSKPNGIHEEQLRRRNYREEIKNNEQKLGKLGRLDNKSVEDVYNNSIKHLISRGLDENHVIEGSVPLSSLIEIDRLLADISDKKFGLGLHIGNFLGLSLNCIAYSMRKSYNSNYLMLSIDPDITHRNIPHPSKYCNELLYLNGLENASIVMNGYSGEKNVSNDGVEFDQSYNPFERFNQEFASTEVIKNLCKILGTKVNIVFIDGHHDATYVRKELLSIEPLLDRDALLIMDDVDSIAWEELNNLFLEISKSNKYQKVIHNDRIGVLRYVG